MIHRCRDGPIVEVLVVMAAGLALASGTYLVVTGHTHIWGMRMRSFDVACLAALRVLGRAADPVRRLSSVYTKVNAGEARPTRLRGSTEPGREGQPRWSGLNEVRAAAKEGRAHRAGCNPRPRAAGGWPRSRIARQLDVLIEFRHVCFSYNPDNSRRADARQRLPHSRPGEVIAVGWKRQGNDVVRTAAAFLRPRQRAV